MTYPHSMIFIETPIFTRQVLEKLSDTQYGRLQSALAAQPDLGSLIRGGNGLRKVRWALPGRGKSGGVRIIYFWRVSESQILMLAIYAKNEQANLTPTQVKQLAQHVETFK
jgi:hypothetical protein